MNQTAPSQEPGGGPLPAVQAVEQLVHEYGKLIFHVLYGYTHNWEQSQDLTQDVFLRAHEGIDAARAVTGRRFQARAWLLRIAVNVAHMQQRRARLYRFLT